MKLKRLPGTASESDVRVFFSTAHPGGAAPELVWTRALAGPLAATMLPVMLVTLAAALEGAGLLPLIIGGFPGAMAVAVLWTRYRLTQTIADLHVRGGEAAVRTVADVLRRRPPLAWHPVLDLRKTKTTFVVALGRTQYEFDDTDWPALDALLAALQRARHANAVFPLPEQRL